MSAQKPQPPARDVPDLGVRQFYDALGDDYVLLFEDWWSSVQRQGAVLAGLLAAPGARVLDIACGIGTQALGLALGGHAVHGRDLSPALVDRARREAAAHGLPATFETGDMCTAHPEDAGRFDVVIAFDNALPHLLEDAQLHAALVAARTALCPGGRFLASVRDYDALSVQRPILDPARLMGVPPTRRIVLQAWHWEPSGRGYTFDLLLVREEPDGTWATTSRRTRYRALLRQDLTAAALRAGLVSPRWYTPAESGFYQPVFEARRPNA